MLVDFVLAILRDYGSLECRELEFSIPPCSPPHVKERSTKKSWPRTLLFALLPLVVLGIVPGMRGSLGAAEPVNLALHKPAYSSSIENDEHNAAQANDGDSDTCWTADDEPEN